MSLTDKAEHWLQTNRREAHDLLALAIAELITLHIFKAFPAAAFLCPLILAALVPFRKSGRPGRWGDFVGALPRRLLAVGATAILLFWLKQPLHLLWFGVLWVLIGWLATLDWSRLSRFPRLTVVTRAALLAAVAFWTTRGFYRSTLCGTADALWYATMLHDTVLQMRAGVFPVWVGQTIYQFNGSICPIRVAPAYPYLGAALDFLTLGWFGPFALQNALIALIGGASVVVAYTCLRALLPRQAWMAACLAILYVTCPGLLSLAYNTHLYMSWTTLPLLPLVWYGTFRSFDTKGGTASLLTIAGALGLCWWAHSPIALWSTLLAGIAQVVRLVIDRRETFNWGASLLAAAVFVAIAGYPVVSVLFYLPPGMTASSFARATPGQISSFLTQSFPGTFLPLSANGFEYSDFQLGYPVWGLLICGLISLRFRFSARPAVPLICAAILALLLLPLAGISNLLWTLVPTMLRNTAGNWAATRLCAPTAAATIFGAAGLLHSVHLRARLRSALTAIVILGSVWSLAETTNFGDGADASALPPDTAQDWMRPENVQLTRFSYSMFPGFPDTYTHGVADPDLENYLVGPGTQGTVASNLEAARRSGTLVATGWFQMNPGGFVDGFTVERTFHIEPKAAYLLDFSFTNPGELRGVLQISGDHFFREYALPEHGGSRAFGAGGDHATAIPVWTTAGPEDLTVRFFTRPEPSEAPYASVGEVRLLSYPPDHLPVVVKGWLPLEAQVTSPMAAWWRTPRMFQAGYTATVDGKSAEVLRTDDGLTRVAVPAGVSSVRLSYRAPAALVALFWIAIVTMVILGAAAVHRFWTAQAPS